MFVAAVGPVDAAEFVEYYKAGVAAIESEDWDRVGEMMQRAIEIQPNAKARIKKGLFFKRYLPHYYLGQALYQSGDCAAALASWQESEAQGVVTRFPEYDQLQAAREDCSRKHSELEYALSLAKGLVVSAGTSGLKARQRLADLQATGVTGAESLVERLAIAESDLRDAEILLGHKSQDLSDLRLSASKAAKARDGFNSISREASQWIQTIASEKVQMRAALNQLAIEGKEALENSTFLDPYPPGIAQRRSRVEDLIKQVSGLGASTGDDEVDALAKDLQQAVLALESSVAEPPRDLTLAAKAFLGGRYSEVLEILAESESGSNKITAQAHLLQAAALFALYHSQGGMQAELLSQARQEVRSCKSVTTAVPIPAPSIFSPRFIEFFKVQQATLVAESGEQTDSK
jgi:hypothetical protein